MGVQTDTLSAQGAAASSGAGAQAVQTTTTRLASLRQGAQYAANDGFGYQTGVATGDAGATQSMWLKPFGSWAKQDTVGSTDGFSAKAYGLAGGWDIEVGNKSVMGLSFAYSNTKIEGKGEGGANT